MTSKEKTKGETYEETYEEKNVKFTNGGSYVSHITFWVCKQINR